MWFVSPLPPRYTEKEGVTIFFICAMQYLYVCVICACVWRPLKCVNSDNAPYFPTPWLQRYRNLLPQVQESQEEEEEEEAHTENILE